MGISALFATGIHANSILYLFYSMRGTLSHFCCYFLYRCFGSTHGLPTWPLLRSSFLFIAHSLSQFINCCDLMAAASAGGVTNPLHCTQPATQDGPAQWRTTQQTAGLPSINEPEMAASTQTAATNGRFVEEILFMNMCTIDRAEVCGEACKTI